MQEECKQACKRVRTEILKWRAEREQTHRELREKEGVVCGCGIKYHPAIDVDHVMLEQHRVFLRDAEGVLCECGVQYHPVLDDTHRFHPCHSAYMKMVVQCECGGKVKRSWLPSHRRSKKHMLLMERIKVRQFLVPNGVQ